MKEKNFILLIIISVMLFLILIFNIVIMATMPSSPKESSDIVTYEFNNVRSEEMYVNIDDTDRPELKTYSIGDTNVSGFFEFENINLTINWETYNYSLVTSGVEWNVINYDSSIYTLMTFEARGSYYSESGSTYYSSLPIYNSEITCEYSLGTSVYEETSLSYSYHDLPQLNIDDDKKMVTIS